MHNYSASYPHTAGLMDIWILFLAIAGKFYYIDLRGREILDKQRRIYLIRNVN